MDIRREKTMLTVWGAAPYSLHIMANDWQAYDLKEERISIHKCHCLDLPHA